MFNKRHIVRTIAATVSILKLCRSPQPVVPASPPHPIPPIRTTSPSRRTSWQALTIATGQPAYEPWVMNDKPESGEGYEAAVAYAGLTSSVSRRATWCGPAPHLDTAIALALRTGISTSSSSASPTSARRPLTSSSYYNDSQSVVVKKDSKFANATKVSDLKDATVGVMVGTPLPTTTLRRTSKDDIQTFNDDAALAQALDAGQIDALVTSTVECVYMVQSEQVKDAKVLGRLPDSEDKSGMGIVLPKDSKLTAAVTKAVDDLNADGTIKKLQDKWLAGVHHRPDRTEEASEVGFIIRSQHLWAGAAGIFLWHPAIPAFRKRATSS